LAEIAKLGVEAASGKELPTTALPLEAPPL
jgi:hypothetical protein